MMDRAARRARNRLLLSARLIVVEHWPEPDGRCPICRLPDCWALATARAYLAMVRDPFVPPRAAADVIGIDSRASGPSGDTGRARDDEATDSADGEGAG
jgi:hypothetical protein